MGIIGNLIKISIIVLLADTMETDEYRSVGIIVLQNGSRPLGYKSNEALGEGSSSNGTDIDQRKTTVSECHSGAEVRIGCW